jgi:hypothetical protein
MAVGFGYGPLVIRGLLISWQVGNRKKTPLTVPLATRQIPLVKRKI